MVEKSKMKLYPFWEVAQSFKEAMDEGAECHQQFNCAKCGVKQTIEEANRFFQSGKCEECGHVTDIEHDGCNWMAHFRL